MPEKQDTLLSLVTALVRRLVDRRISEVRHGPPGPTGECGPAGPAGPQGVQGVRGEKGDVGERGEQGSRGVAGPIGVQGEPGQVGSVGPAGPRGERGEQGPQGERGPRGFPPRHRWQGTRLQFTHPDGSWGSLTDLRGPAGVLHAVGRFFGGGGGGGGGGVAGSVLAYVEDGTEHLIALTGAGEVPAYDKDGNSVDFNIVTS